MPPVGRSSSMEVSRKLNRDRAGGFFKTKTMAFIILPVVYVEVDPEDEDGEISRIKNKGKSKPPLKADVTININNICTYVGINENNHTMIFTSDGNAYECIYDRDTVDEMIQKTEAIIDLTTIADN